MGAGAGVAWAREGVGAVSRRDSRVSRPSLASRLSLGPVGGALLKTAGPRGGERPGASAGARTGLRCFAGAWLDDRDRGRDGLGECGIGRSSGRAGAGWGDDRREMSRECMTDGGTGSRGGGDGRLLEGPKRSSRRSMLGDRRLYGTPRGGESRRGPGLRLSRSLASRGSRRSRPMGDRDRPLYAMLESASRFA